MLAGLHCVFEFTSAHSVFPGQHGSQVSQVIPHDVSEDRQVPFLRIAKPCLDIVYREMSLEIPPDNNQGERLEGVVQHQQKVINQRSIM